MRAMGLHRSAYAFPTLLVLLSIGPSITLSQAEPANAVPTTKSFPITTLINAKWSQTPLHLEIAEYLADENAGHYWDFIDGLAALEMPLNVYDTESKQYNAAIQVARNSLSSMQLPLLKLVVAMHSLTPRIQTHFQLANEALSLAGGSKCAGSGAFVQIGSQLACDLAAMKQQLARSSDPDTLDAAVETYSFDHIYPGSENITRTAVLYGDVASNEFASCHKYLVEQSAAGKVRYIARHYLAKQPERRVRLSGYGVELHLKSTEYKSQDDSPKPGDNEPGSRSDEDGSRGDDSAMENEVHGFDFRVLKQRHPTLSHSLDKFRQSLLQGSDEIVQLKAWEFQDLGLQAAAAIAAIKGEEALQIMQFTAQNFPMQTRALLGQKVSDELREEVKHNTEVLGRSLNIVPPDGALFVNGLFFDADTMDLGALVETLRSEVRVMEALEQNNVRGPVATALLGLDLSATGGREFAIDIRDTAIVWVNNIETDPQYRRWPSSVMDLLRPTFPGMLRNIRKNVFNLVVVVDPVEPGRTRDLLKMAESFIVHNAPVRLGLVLDSRRGEDSPAEEVYLALTCVFNYVTQHKDARYALNFLNLMYTEMNEGEPVKVSDLRSNLKASFKSLTNKQFDEIIEEGSAYDYGRQLAQEFVERIGFAASPQVLLNGVPMQSHLLESDSDFEETVFSDILQQTTTLQKAVYREELTDSEDILDYLMNQPHVMPRLNQRILSTENNKYLDLSGTPNENLGNVKGLAQLSNRDMTATLLHNIKYFGGKHATERIGNAELHFLTIWVFGDLEEPSGRDALAQALKYVKAGSSVRVAFIPNTEGAAVGKKDNLNRLVWAASQTLAPIEATDVVLKWLKQWPQPPKDIPEPIFEVLLDTELHMKMLRVYSQRVLELRKSEVLIVGNGKIYGPLNKDEKFSIDDFGLIDRLSTFQYGDKIRKVLKKTASSKDAELNISSDILLKLYSSLLSRQSKTRFKLPVDLKSEHSMVQLEAKHPELPQIEITAVIDPASRSAQRVAPVLVVLRQILNCRMSVYLTPVSQHSDMPVKNFYRYVVEPEVGFEPNGRMAEGPYAKFTGVPANPLLTQNLQVPDNWLVEAVRAVYDLDNIKLSEIGGPVHSEYELEYLLLEGHCFDAANGSPPRGLQVTLGTKERPVMVDTIVMANLGYFQLKANPGAWELRLRDGKSADIYDITYAEGPNTVHYNHTTKVVISSLRSHVIKLRVSKKPGKQNADLLSEDDEQGGSSLWNSIASSFGGGGSEGGGGDDDSETINIFSVASGHLYERLLRIMMVSLLKHTKSPVKFWFLKNYLSPQFNDLLPHMAREYGFQYELVQYKWPRWLHQQSEKQRIIWGYKILFLDVLFPLNVRKIIFVDADAIVRADIKELYDMDLGGAPYAYTPFCDSRKEMEGFRFWKQGYWRNHLMGRHYHISALYVVDLKRFRRIAAGDRLRGQYQALSQDPNSLSNLDQDLPNNMIHQVAIKSLPSEWLWCQTWCSDKSFKTAKVIDLCNNPQTKEAKLTAAQRIVPEWKDYDAEIKRLQAKIEDHENSEYHEATTTAKEAERISKELVEEEKEAEQQQQEHGASQHSEL